MKDADDYRSLAENLLEEHDAVTLLAAALKVMTRERDQTPLQNLTLAPPIIVKGNYTGRPKRNSSKGKSNQPRNDHKHRRSKIYTN